MQSVLLYPELSSIDIVVILRLVFLTIIQVRRKSLKIEINVKIKR